MRPLYAETTTSNLKQPANQCWVAYDAYERKIAETTDIGLKKVVTLGNFLVVKTSVMDVAPT